MSEAKPEASRLTGTGPVTETPRGSALGMVALIVAGEAAFLLPFVLPRVFRPTLLRALDVTNLELGTAFSVYGLVAMVAYFPGGPLADRFAARVLIAAALATTALGGVAAWWLSGSQGLPVWQLTSLYAFWGVTTVLLFWAALIRATREWGGPQTQGTAFGLLDGGRGLFAAATGSALVAVFASLLPEGRAVTVAERADAFGVLMLIVSGMTGAAALLSYVALPPPSPGRLIGGGTRSSLSGVVRVLQMPNVWLQAAVIVCAYVGYKATDDFSLYAQDALKLGEVESARVGSWLLWTRPVAAIAAGLIGDRLGLFRTLAGSFILLAAGCGVIVSGLLGPGMLGPFLVTVAATGAGIFALRGVYYAIMGEAGIPLVLTGSATGIVSVVGYTPDVFMSPLMGALLDNSPGELGHQHVFAVVGSFALAGIVVTGLLARRVAVRNAAEPTPVPPGT